MSRICSYARFSTIDYEKCQLQFNMPLVYCLLIYLVLQGWVSQHFISQAGIAFVALTRLNVLILKSPVESQNTYSSGHGLTCLGGLPSHVIVQMYLLGCKRPFAPKTRRIRLITAETKVYSCDACERSHNNADDCSIQSLKSHVQSREPTYFQCYISK